MSTPPTEDSVHFIVDVFPKLDSHGIETVLHQRRIHKENTGLSYIKDLNDVLKSLDLISINVMSVADPQIPRVEKGANLECCYRGEYSAILRRVLHRINSSFGRVHRLD